MKRILGLVFLVSSVASFANDSGAYLIDVEGIDPSNGLSGSKRVSAKDGSGFQIDGPGAVNLAKRLPPTSFTLQPEQGKYSRAIHMFSRGWQLSIKCVTATISEDDGSIVEAWENNAECEINLWKTSQNSRDEVDFEALKESDYKVADEDRAVQEINANLIVPTRKPQERFDDCPTAKSGTKISFYGKDVEQFLRIMPDSKKYVINGEGKPADGMDNKLVISCEKAKNPAESKCSVEYTETNR